MNVTEIASATLPCMSAASKVAVYSPAGSPPVNVGIANELSVAFAWSGGTADAAAWADLYRLPERWQRPRFPLGGRDALGAGASHGPAVGAFLKHLEAWWIAEDFAPDAAMLRSRLQQMIAAAQ